ncbi:hypothetical protein J6590_034322 [Homalodisca vitripennis]|nr:hypothetical protein J6590_034322 [Homalodisca vitripennis]
MVLRQCFHEQGFSIHEVQLEENEPTRCHSTRAKSTSYNPQATSRRCNTDEEMNVGIPCGIAALRLK